MKQYERLVRNVKKVYPYAIEARQYMRTLETELDKIKSPREREKFIASMEKEIVVKYTPILEKMTYTQGKILIKLIDRETSRTPYQLLRDFRGRFTAGFYNAIAKIFKADLKQHYDLPGRGGCHDRADYHPDRCRVAVKAPLCRRTENAGKHRGTFDERTPDASLPEYDDRHAPPCFRAAFFSRLRRRPLTIPEVMPV